MNERIFVALDVETTGLQAGVDEIIEFAAVKFRAGEILERYSQLIAPHQPLPLKITRLTGIRPEDLVGAPRFNEVGADIARFIKSYPLVGHSVGFDLGMLRAHGMNFSQPVYDTFELATLLMPQIPVYKLGAIAERLGIPHPADHRALNDSEVTAQVFTHLLGLIEQLNLRELSEISRLTARVAFPMRDLFEEALRIRAKNVFVEASGPRPPAPGPRPPAPGSAEYLPLRPTGDASPLDLDSIDRFFAADGALGQAFPGYEQRKPQADMARAVAQAFNHSEPLIVEAGTGTGKSWAYLTPAAMFAAQRGERVVISTNTINLQDQLFTKDIPDLQRIMAGGPAQAVSDEGDRIFGSLEAAPPFTAALLKGRSNYLCLKRYHELRRSESLSPEEVRSLIKIQIWIPTTLSGDKAELLLLDRENAAWGRVNVTPETCTGARCEHFRECYFFQARRQAEAAHIVVVNHALLIADLTAQSNVLPPYAHVIVDEAHNLEDVATDQLSFMVDQAALLKFLDDLYQEGGAQVVSGLLADLPRHVNQSAADRAACEKVEQICQQLQPSLMRARVTIYECFNQLTSFVNSAVEANQYDSRLRLIPEVRKKDAWLAIQASWQYLIDGLAVIGDGLGNIETMLRDMESDGVSGDEELLLRLSFLVRFALEARVQTSHIIFGNEESICWLNHD
ncbi:MAG: DEAD/DEAH box helicase family protein, partial [Oscillochloris sp.]|nr:DEAD/DEAH box helicase family protein [Oscillochloris sp.]